MKAILEKVPQRIGCSWRLKKIREHEKAFNWHYHNKEFELLIHRNFRSHCHIGHFQGQLSENSMILIAPNVPHAIDAIPDNNIDSYETFVLWFKQDWIANMMFSCQELRKIESLLKRAEKGLLFSHQTAEYVAEIIESVDESDFDPINLLAKFILIVEVLCQDKESKTLLSYNRDQKGNDQTNREKIERLCAFIDQNYHQPLTLEDAANCICTSESSIHRLFEQHFNESFTQYLKKLRLNHAAENLVSTADPISHIAEQVGYRNQANFNRQFKQYKGMTPREYRQHYKLDAKV
ncbi:helix-turn-helix transcriptional regulator [Photobacterium leiognathi]|uniref:helix-turn-helix transcriptional regulator n=1 Tax=Photobacterium leiognathi TaxID=553611 RepID=UPI0002088D2A|nr:AraC family transcriptional regulator [Photobacterium leiognathi]PSW55073.1 AraC family transcriptional regulator [Photobacterium leiognathi subsp. mandapamensis]GAA06335.1 bacterial regulatory helix-turn-helix s, AraC family protein [Photobacterium leiognathi subsp. mandapamensis svers.1.1.]